MEQVLRFFAANTPPWWVVLTLGPVLWLVARLALHAAAALRRRGVRTGITRKVFHFLVFATAGALQVWAGTPLLCLFGGMTSLVVLAAVLRGDGDPGYEALARPGDAPHRTWYIVVPYLATALGGLVTAMALPRTALAGFLVTGIADAIAEPVGVRFGRHRYRVILPGRVASWRSVEGSTAVLLGSLLALALAAAQVTGGRAATWVVPVLWIAVVCAVLEAVSPHGWDNLVLQVAPAWLLHLALAPA